VGAVTGTRLRGGSDIAGEGPQDARHHDAFLDGQVAAVGIGDDAEALLDATEIRVVAGSGADPVERGGDVAGAELARWALAARLDVQEPRPSARWLVSQHVTRRIRMVGHGGRRPVRFSAKDAMTDTPSDQAPLRPRAADEERPRHPTGQAAWLLVGVTLLIVALAVLSSYGRI